MRHKNESGFVFIFFTIFIVTLIIVAGYVIDLSKARDEQRRIQYASDSAAIAGAYYVGYSSNTTVTNQAQAAGNANSLQNSEILSVDCGRWIRGNECTQSLCRTYVQCGNGAPCADCQDSKANAVRVQSKRTVNNTFARLMGQNSITTNVRAIALAVPKSTNGCIKPVGVVYTYLTGLVAGSTFTIRRNAPGNWGKLDVGGVNYSSGNNFTDAILGNGACGPEVYVGGQVQSSTGNGGSIDHALDDAISQGKNFNWILPVITEQSNGQNTVTIVEFLQVDLLSSQGSGNGWNGTFRIVARGVGPGTPPPTAGGQNRYLVK